jgi:DNA polymerase III delta prime subunit
VTINRQNADWVNKYRPDRLEDMILPAAHKVKLINLRDSRRGFGLILHGPIGCGKTTVGLLMGSTKPVRVDCAIENSKAHILQYITRARSLLEEEDIRVILMDEADQLTESAQSVLRAFGQDMLLHNAFILTTNDLQKLHPQLHSRFTPEL